MANTLSQSFMKKPTEYIRVSPLSKSIVPYALLLGTKNGVNTLPLSVF